MNNRKAILTSGVVTTTTVLGSVPIVATRAVNVTRENNDMFDRLEVKSDLCSPLVKGKGTSVLVKFRPTRAIQVLPCLGRGKAIMMDGHPVVPIATSLRKTSCGKVRVVRCLGRGMRGLRVVSASGTYGSLKSSGILGVMLLNTTIEDNYLKLDRRSVLGTVDGGVPRGFRRLGGGTFRCCSPS